MILLKIVSLGFIAVASARCAILMQQIKAEFNKNELVYKALIASVALVWISTFIIAIVIITT